MREYLPFLLVVLLALAGLFYTGKAWSDCNDKGGEYVRGLNGLYKCVQVVQEK